MASAAVLFSKGEEQEVLVDGNSHVKVVILNRAQKLNALTYQMVLDLLKAFKAFEKEPSINLVILKANGRAFCAGGDIKAMVQYVTAGHWTFASQFFLKKLALDYILATYRKPQVCLINGLVMGGGAGISMLGKFRIVTEKTVFSMPETALGHFPDVGASYFLSRLPGYFGEYVGLTGASLNGAEMLGCGLATHFVHSKNLHLMEEKLWKVNTADPSVICAIIKDHEVQPPPAKDSVYQRLDIINRCFSKVSVEEILFSLEYESVHDNDEWISGTIKSIRMASPTKLKLFLRSIREGRVQELDECLHREYKMISHVMRRTVCNDFFEGTRAKLLDRDNKPKWDPLELELVTNDMLDKYYSELDEDEGWEELKLRSNKFNSTRAKL